MDRVRDLVRMAARAEADRRGWEIAARWHLLKKEAGDGPASANLIPRRRRR